MRSATAQKPAGVTPDAAPAAAPEVEATAAGFQTLIAGVAPLSSRARLQVRADAPLMPKRAQKRCDLGLFDEASRRQTDLVDLLRLLECGGRV